MESVPKDPRKSSEPESAGIFICYRRKDGSDAAQWLYENLRNRIISLGAPGSTKNYKLAPYYDKTAPAVKDWKTDVLDPALEKARAFLMVCTHEAYLRREKKDDWVYEEIRWWVKHREAAPIVVEAQDLGDEWVPKPIRERWPMIQRVRIEPQKWRQQKTNETQSAARNALEQIIGGIRESEYQVSYEDLQKQKTRTRQLKTQRRWLVVFSVAAVLFCILAVMLGYMFREKAREARIQTQMAETQRDRAEMQRRLATARQLASDALANIGSTSDDLVRSTLLAGASLSHILTAEGYKAWERTMVMLPRRAYRLEQGGGGKALAVNPVNGQIIIAYNPFFNNLFSRGTIRIWDRGGGPPVAEITCDQSVFSIAVSPDGRLLAAGARGKIFVWDLESREEVVQLSASAFNVLAVAFNPDGTRLAGDATDGIRIWNTAGWNQIGKTLPMDTVVHTIGFSPDGKLVAAGGGNTFTDPKAGFIKIWTAATGDFVKYLKQSGVVQCLSFSPDGKVLAVGSRGSLVFWDVESWSAAKTYPGTGVVSEGVASEAKNPAVSSVAFSPGGDLFTAMDDSAGRIFDARTLEEILRLPQTSKFAVFSADGTLLIDSNAWVWELVPGTDQMRFAAGKREMIESFAVSPSGEWLAVKLHRFPNYRAPHNIIKIWYCADGRTAANLMHEGEFSSMVFSPDSSRIATLINGMQSSRIYLWDVASGKQIAVIDHPPSVRLLRYSPDSALIATSSSGDVLRIWNAGNGQLLRETGFQAPVEDFRFSPDSRRLVVACRDGRLQIYAAETGSRLQSIPHQPGASQVILNADGSRVLSITEDRETTLWDIHAEPVKAISRWTDCRLATFSPNGKYFLATIRHLGRQFGQPASASPADFRISWNALLIDAQSGQQLHDFIHREPNDPYRVMNKPEQIVFSPGGELVVVAGNTGFSGNESGTVRGWRTDSGKEIFQQKYPRSVLQMAFSPDGRLLGILTAEQLRLWDVVDRLDVAVIQTGANIHAFEFSPAGKPRLVIQDEKSVRLRLWETPDLIKKTCLRLYRNHPSALPGFRRDDQNLPAVCEDFILNPDYIHTKTAADPVLNSGKTEREIQTLLELDPRSDMVPAAEARQVAAFKFRQDGERLARLGAIAKAAAQFEIARRLNPEAYLNPEKEARRIAAEVSASEADGLAREGEIEAAAEKYEKAAGLNPDLKEVLKERLIKLGVPALVARGESLGRNGDFDEALEAFKRAKRLKPDLAFDPEAKVRELERDVLLEQAEELARLGRIEDAITRYERAESLGAAPDPNRRAKVTQIAVERFLEESKRLAVEGRIAEALRVLEKVAGIIPVEDIPAESWNSLCWYGSLWQHVDTVMDYCIRAVHLDPENGAYRDSRGVALALTGDNRNAVEDFKFYIEWGRHNRRPEAIAQRQAWIEALEQNRNPFTLDILESLRKR